MYGFALLAHKDQATLDPLDVGQWRFFVVPTWKPNKRSRSQHSITLPSLTHLVGDPISYSQLKQAIQNARRAAAR